MAKQRRLQTAQEKSAKMIAIYDKKREAYFATDPRCKECGKALDHMSRLMTCRHCQKTLGAAKRLAADPGHRKRYRQKNKKRIQAYHKQYYLAHKEEISQYKKIRYQKEKEARRANV